MAEVREAFTACVSDRNQDVSDTLKRGALMLMSSLLSISFRLNNFAIVQSYVTMIEVSATTVTAHCTISNAFLCREIA